MSSTSEEEWSKNKAPRPPVGKTRWADEDSDGDVVLQYQMSDASGSSFCESVEESEDDVNVPLPDHACRYCHCHDPSAVVRCHVCKKWFCNSRGGGRASHIVNHLARSRHKEISLHPESPLGDQVLECYVCGSKNIFMLGFVPSAEDSVVILLCREPCLSSSDTLRDMVWDPDSWQALIEDRQFLPWLVRTGPQLQCNTECGDKTRGNRKAEGYRRVRQITIAQMGRLEDAWKTQPDAELRDVMRGGIGRNSGDDLAPLPPVPALFRDGSHYLGCFTPLLEAEARCCQQMKENFTFERVALHWTHGLNKRSVAVLQLPMVDAKVVPGDEVTISHSSTQFEEKATILKIAATASAADEFHCELQRGGCELPAATPGGLNSEGCYNVRFVWKSITFDRMSAAMRKMCEDETSLSAYLFNRVIALPWDRPVPKVKTEIPDGKCIATPGLNELNSSQEHAARTCLSRPLTLIQGPPGTGKTVMSATIVYQMVKMTGSQALVCSPSNIAVDQLAERLHRTGLKIVRVCAKTRESITTTVDKLTLHHQLRQVCEAAPNTNELKQLLRLRDETGVLSDRDKKRFALLASKVEAELLDAADVVCCTCSAAGDKRLSKFRFHHVLVDECTQATEPESIIPIVLGAKQLVLVGDHCQMGPVIMEKRADAAGMGRTLFERLVQLGEAPVRLDVQYRMHPCLSEFSSECFYEGTLQNGVTAMDRDASTVFPWPDATTPMFFYNSIAPEEVAGNGTSFLNRSEAALAERIVTTLIRNGTSAAGIGVITPYEGQRSYLLNYLARNGALGTDAYVPVEVASVDSFQGREKEVVVLTCVRSNDHQGIGFLSDWRRLNVALTRARRGMIIVGNARVLARHPLWHSLVSHFKKQKLVVDGPLQSLSTVAVVLPKPRADPHIQGPAWVHVTVDPHRGRGNSVVEAHPPGAMPPIPAPHVHHPRMYQMAPMHGTAEGYIPDSDVQVGGQRYSSAAAAVAAASAAAYGKGIAGGGRPLMLSTEEADQMLRAPPSPASTAATPPGAPSIASTPAIRPAVASATPAPMEVQYIPGRKLAHSSYASALTSGPPLSGAHRPRSFGKGTKK